MLTWDCCRMCLNKNDLDPITSVLKEIESNEIIFYVTGVKITLNDQLPKQICKECTDFIENSSKFREKCQETQKILFDELKNRTHRLKTEIGYHCTGIDCKYLAIDLKEIKQEENLENNNLLVTENVENHNLENDSPQLFTEDSYSMQNYDENFKNTNSTVFNKPIDNEMLKLLTEINNTKVKFKTKINNTTKTKKKELKTPTKLMKNKLNDKVNNKVNGNSEVLLKCEKKPCIREEVKCDHCDKILSSKSSLRCHMKIHTGFEVVCEHCGKKCGSKPRLLMHCKAKHGYEKTDKCSYCDYKGCNSEQVKIHERTHTGERPYVCKDCDATFLRPSCYLQHVATHLPEKTVQCAQCPAKFKSVTLMKIHTNKHRMTHFSFKCYVCDSSFARRRNVLRHLRRIHAVSDPTRKIERVIK